MKKTAILLLALSLLLSCCGCSRNDSPTPAVPDATVPVADYEDIFTDRDLDSGYSDPEAIVLSDETGSVTITKGGTYLLSGTLTNGQVIVSAGDGDKVQLVLSGVSITCENSAAIYIPSADKVFVTLAENTRNTLQVTGEFQQTDDNSVDAAIFAKCDLTFNGKGSLTVNCAEGHGIVTKDDLKFTGGTYTVEAAGQGLCGKDSLSVADGTFTITSGTDGLQSKHDENADKGKIYIAGGSFSITAGTDAMDASNTLVILGGTITAVTGGGSTAASANNGGMSNRPGTVTTSGDGSWKGLKAAAGLVISGGILNLDTRDDGLHSNGTVQISGGELTISAGDDGIHADDTLQISGGTIRITKSYEGLEGTNIFISGGDIALTAQDDGINAANGSGTSGGFGPPMNQTVSNCGITITGGQLLIDAGGDGMDSNGTLTVTGGTVFIDGPTSSSNGALDYDSSAAISGGTVFALGSSGMAQNFGNGSTQGSILYTLTSAQAADTHITLSDNQGNVLAEYTARKPFQSIVVSAPGIASGSTYVLQIGAQRIEIEMTGLLYTSGGGGMPGRPGGGGRPR